MLVIDTNKSMNELKINKKISCRRGTTLNSLCITQAIDNDTI